MNVKRDVIPLLKETWQEFQDDDAGNMSASLSYYALFSIFPLLLLLIAFLGFALRYYPTADNAQDAILNAVAQNFSPQLSDTLSQILAGVENQAGAATGVGLITLLLGASGLFQQLDVSFNKIWKVPKDNGPASIVGKIKLFITQKLLSFGMVLAVGFLLLVSLALTGITQAVLQGASAFLGFGEESLVTTIVSTIVGTLVTLLLNTLIFALLFKFLPDTTVRWGDVFLGALVTAVIWEIAKRLLAIYIGNMGQNAAVYGAVGSVLVLIAWVYFTSLVLYLGAEFTQVYACRHGSHADETARAEAPKVAPAPVILPAPVSSTPNPQTRLAAATGAGLVVGVVGGIIAGVAAMVIGSRSAISSVTRRFRRGSKASA
jgi:membrane protein